MKILWTCYFSIFYIIKKFLQFSTSIFIYFLLFKFDLKINLIFPHPMHVTKPDTTSKLENVKVSPLLPRKKHLLPKNISFLQNQNPKLRFSPRRRRRRRHRRKFLPLPVAATTERQLTRLSCTFWFDLSLNYWLILLFGFWMKNSK